MVDRIALIVASTVAVVLLAIVADLIVRGHITGSDRVATLAALGAIGLALAAGLARYMGGGKRPD